jgi:hypothetical protein
MLWRIKQLVAAGELDVQGELKGMKDFEIKGKTLAPAGQPVMQEGAWKPEQL